MLLPKDHAVQGCPPRIVRLDPPYQYVCIHVLNGMLSDWLTLYRAASSQTGASEAIVMKDATLPPSQTDVDNSTSGGPSNAQRSSGNRAPQQLGSLIPGSFDYYIRLAETRLAGAKSPRQSVAASAGRRPALTGSQQLQEVISRRDRHSSNSSVLELLEMDTWTAALQTYHEEIGMQYPFLDMESLARRIQSARENKCRHDSRIEDIACLIVGLVASLEDPAAVDVAGALVHEIFNAAIIRVHTSADGSDKDDISLLILASMSFFLSDREVQAWRCIGTVMRLLHETCCYDSNHQIVPDTLYWTAYTLDRRWSFGTGLPFAVSDADIRSTGPPLLRDDQSLSSAYLKQMVAYCGISSEIRRSVLDQPQSPNNHDVARDFAHFRVIQWQNNLPKKLRFRGVHDKFDPALEKRGEYKLRLMLHLRANQMRIIILRRSAPISTSSEPLPMESPSSTQTMLDVAQETIRILVYLGKDTDIYHAQHRTFNHFLETALSSLLLVVCGASLATSSNNPPCLGDVMAAIDLIRLLSQKSHITRKLHEKLHVIQQAVGSLKTPRPEVQLAERSSIDPEPVAHSRCSTRPESNDQLSSTSKLRLINENATQSEEAEAVAPSTLPSVLFSRSDSISQQSVTMSPTNLPPDDFTSPRYPSSIFDGSLPGTVMGGGAMPLGGNMLADLDESLLQELNDVLTDYENFAF